MAEKGGFGFPDHNQDEWLENERISRRKRRQILLNFLPDIQNICF